MQDVGAPSEEMINTSRDKTDLVIVGWIIVTVLVWAFALVIEFVVHDKNSNFGTVLGIIWSLFQGIAGGFAFGLGGAFVGGIFGTIISGLISSLFSRGKLPSDRRISWFGAFGYHGFMLGGSLGTIAVPVFFALESGHFLKAIDSQNILLGSLIGGFAGGFVGDIIDEIREAMGYEV